MLHVIWRPSPLAGIEVSMCTLTILREENRVIITMSRDDLIARPEEPPASRGAGVATFLAPLDLRAGGTWIGLNTHGLVACLLNRYDQPPPANAMSRGAIVPTALKTAQIDDAIVAVLALDLSRFAPFTCVLVSHVSATKLDWTGNQMLLAPIDQSATWMTTSSSVAQVEVKAKRKDFFDRTMKQLGAPTDLIRRFHTTSTSEDAWWSPWMARENAHTKSVTQVWLEPHGNQMHYWDRAAICEHGLVAPSFAIADAVFN
jgi:hypothetical protein